MGESAVDLVEVRKDRHHVQPHLQPRVLQRETGVLLPNNQRQHLAHAEGSAALRIALCKVQPGDYLVTSRIHLTEDLGSPVCTRGGVLIINCAFCKGGVTIESRYNQILLMRLLLICP